MMLETGTKRHRAFLGNVVHQVFLTIFFTLLLFADQQFGPDKHQSASLHHEAGQPAVRYTHPEQVLTQPFATTSRPQPQIKQTKAGHTDLLWEEPNRFTEGFVLL